ncbi:MAG: CPBP family intramembrane metalloprotease [Deltaproteobacteria bacterium]|nr:CPBP family intramembrane metalloprotease [Deltaproteobacteria bacterium]
MPTRSSTILVFAHFAAVMIVLKGLQWACHVAGRPMLLASLGPFVWLLAVLFTRPNRRGVEIDLGPVKTGILDALLYGAPAIGLYVLGYWLLRPVHMPSPAPLDLVVIVATYVFANAAPEEIYFRGYLQGRLALDDETILRTGPFVWTNSIVISAALFALAHFILVPQPIRLMTFFPGLLFGYLRFRSTGLLAPILAHAAANLALYALQGHV